MLLESALTEKVIGLSREVHRGLGPGLLESAYETCLCFELREAEIPFQRQVGFPSSTRACASMPASEPIFWSRVALF